VFSAIWGICFSLKANPDALKTMDWFTVGAQSSPLQELVIGGFRREKLEQATLVMLAVLEFARNYAQSIILTTENLTSHSER
jgi:hypothetical protein